MTNVLPQRTHMSHRLTLRKNMPGRRLSRYPGVFRLETLFPQNKQFLSLSSWSRKEAPTPSQLGPPPIRVGLTESAGRGVFATRRIGAGDLIHTASPILAHPSLTLIHTVCYFCLKKLRRSEGYNDSSLLFCSEECRAYAKGFYDVETRTDWSAFDDHCRTHGFKYPLLVKRLACMVISGTARVDSLDILQPAPLIPEMVLKLEEGFGLLWNTVRKANLKDENVAFLTKQWYSNVLARIRINAFRVELALDLYEDLLASAAAVVEAEGSVGNAVYMLPSFYNHDCDPNSNIVWIENAHARLKTLRDVEEGEELRICYIDASMSCEARQAVLLQGFGFYCNCLRCQHGD